MHMDCLWPRALPKAQQCYLVAENRDGTREIATPPWEAMRMRGQIIDEAAFNFRLFDVAAVEVVGGALNGWRIVNPHCPTKAEREGGN